MPEITNPGFDRPKIEPLHGTVKFYQRHIFICTGTRDWPAHIDRAGGFGQVLASAIEEQASAMPRAVKLTACDEPSPGAGPGAFDLLVFPDAVRYLGISEADIATFVADYLVDDQPSPRLRHVPFLGRHIFVCGHAARDPRCGACGPPLLELFAAELARMQLPGVTVHCTSHVGGHQYAGNVLIYPEGVWYGYVTPGDVPRIVEQHLLSGEIVHDLWRGQMART